MAVLFAIVWLLVSLVIGYTLVASALVLVAAPFVAVWLLAREAVGLIRRYREGSDPLAELQERYVGGELTIEEFEATVGAALVAPRPRRRLSPFGSAAVVDVCLALALLLVAHSALARVSGALLGVAGLVGPIPRRIAIYAFVAGLALLTAPLVGIAFGASAAYRGLAERRG
jgi:hypothetical protein